jgi:hypothetical protein
VDRGVGTSFLNLNRESTRGSRSGRLRGHGYFDLLDQHFPVADWEQSLHAVETNCVRPDQDARLVALDSANNAVGGGFGRRDGEAFEAGDGEIADRRMNSGADACICSNGRADSSRMRARDAYGSAFEFVLQDFREAADGEFCGAVGGLPGGRNQAEQARDIDDVSARLAAEDRQKISNAINDAPEIDLHEPFEIGKRDFLEISVEGDAGVVDEQGDTLVMLEDFGGEVFHGARVADVESMRGDGDFFGFDLARCVEQAGFIYIGEGERHFFVGEAMSECAADAGSRASDDGDAAFEFPGQERSFLRRKLAKIGGDV